MHRYTDDPFEIIFQKIVFNILSIILMNSFSTLRWALKWIEKLSFNPVWSDAKGRHEFGLALAQVMACCLTGPSHYLNQCV